MKTKEVRRWHHSCTCNSLVIVENESYLIDDHSSDPGLAICMVDVMA